jgi:uncharacterized protein YjbK
MTAGREVELKFALPDDDAAAALEAQAGGSRRSCVRQTNHVFDTDDRRLREAGLTLRLREEEGAWTVTLKGPTKRLGAARDREELEAAVAPERAAAMLRGEASPLDVLDASEALVGEAASRSAGALVRLGTFHNRRVRVEADLPGHGPATLEIDRTELPGGRVDREVELEVPAGPAGTSDVASAERALRALLAGIGVDAVEASGKTGRFLSALDGTGT